MRVKLSHLCPDVYLNLGGILLMRGEDFKEIPDIPEVQQALSMGYLEALKEEKQGKLLSKKQVFG